MNGQNDLLILAIGNPARGDDGLGPQFLCELKKQNIESPHFRWSYQLNIEDAEQFSHFKKILIVDAQKDGDLPFNFETVLPSETCHFSSHILLPQNVLALTVYLYNKQPEVYLLAITGSDFHFSEQLSTLAHANLLQAVNYIILKFPEFQTSRLTSMS